MNVLTGMGYGQRGNLSIKCWRCGEVKSFYTKNEIEVFTCKNCGCKTALDKTTVAYLECECGNHAKYRTNSNTPFEIECFVCGQPVAMYPVKSRKKNIVYASSYSIEQREEKLRSKRR